MTPSTQAGLVMDGFKRLTGFVPSTGPAGHEITPQSLDLDGQRLRSRVNRRSYGTGQLDLVSLATLRHSASLAPLRGRRNSFNIVPSDVRQLHAATGSAETPQPIYPSLSTRAPPGRLTPPAIRPACRMACGCTRAKC